jgi:hypothetical protein
MSAWLDFFQFHAPPPHASLDQAGMGLLRKPLPLTSAITSNVCRHTSSVVESMPSGLCLVPLPPLENRRHPLAATDTHGFQPVARITPLHFVQ